MGIGPPFNFKSLLHYLIDNYSGCVPSFNITTSSPSAPPTVSLPITLQQLKESFEVGAPHEVHRMYKRLQSIILCFFYPKAGLLLPPVRTVTDVRRSMLVDLIIVSNINCVTHIHSST